MNRIPTSAESPHARVGALRRLIVTLLFPVAILMSLCLMPTPSVAVGQVTTLYSFKCPIGNPQSSLVEGDDGNYYGATSGGDFFGGGYAAVYKVTPAGVLSTVHSFANEKLTSVSGLVKGVDGSLYGTTPYGNGGSGTAFKITSSGAYTILHFFSASSGMHPNGELTLGADGNLYGAAAWGARELGVVYRLTTAGTYTDLHDFTVADNVTNSTPLAEGPSGILYGASNDGGVNGLGCVFSVSTSGVVTLLHSFTSTEGTEISPLTFGQDGKLYGTTTYGPSNGPGTAFSLSTNGAGFKTIHTFPAGTNPTGRLTLAAHGAFYGETSKSGAAAIYKMTTAGSVSTMHALSIDGEGSSPVSLTLGSDGKMYGAAENWGPHNRGTVFTIAGDGTFSVLNSFDFTGPDGYDPFGSLVQANDGNFYGTTWAGGAHDKGTVYRLSQAGVITTIHSFDGTDGVRPGAGLTIAADGFLYGTTIGGGTVGDFGTIFKISTGGAFTSLHSFNGVDGSEPATEMVQARDGNFYGSTAGDGTLFKATPQGVVTRLHLFGNVNYYPGPTLSLGSDGIIYGAYSPGDTGTAGVAYKIDPVSGYNSLYTFTSNEPGAFPLNLILGVDGYLYGSGQGYVFKMPASGDVISDYFEGPSPNSPIFQATDDNIYYRSGYPSSFSVTALQPSTSYQVHIANLPAGDEGVQSFMEGRDRSLYAVTFHGGVDNCGSVVKVVPPPLVAPTVKAINGTNAVRLTWTSKSLGSCKFNIYLSNGGDGDTDYLYKPALSGNSFTDALPANTQRNYRVSAVSAEGEGPKSDVVYGTSLAPATASFVTVDSTTKGNWQGVYGIAGYNVIGDTGYNNGVYPDATADPSTYSSGIWSTSPFDTRCLRTIGGKGRIAGVWYQGSLTLTVTANHYVALYLLDLNNAGYAEHITVTDTITGALLDARTAASFSGGAYYVWNINGTVNITLTPTTSGGRAVLSGIFFGQTDSVTPAAAPTNLKASGGSAKATLTWTASPTATSYNVYRGTSSGAESYTPVLTNVTTTTCDDPGLTPGGTYYYRVIPVNGYGLGLPSTEVAVTLPSATATFVTVDTTTQGNWRDAYGADGYNVIGDPAANNPYYSGDVSLTAGTHNSGVWSASSQSPACLQTAAPGSAVRLAGVWFQTTWTMNVTSTGTHQFALYLLDQPNAGYAETIAIKDAAKGTVLDTESASGFAGGKYYVWNISGNVTVTLTSTVGHWAVVSGIFFGGATGSPPPV